MQSTRRAPHSRRDLPGQQPLPGFVAADLERKPANPKCPVCGVAASREPNLLNQHGDRLVCIPCGTSWFLPRPKRPRGAR